MEEFLQVLAMMPDDLDDEFSTTPFKYSALAKDFDSSTACLERIPGSVYQAELLCNRLLPYADQLEKKADKLLAQIKAGLGKCVMLRDINNGCLDWCYSLNMYLRLYGLRFTKDEHIVFIKLFYELVTIQDLEEKSLGRFVETLILLLKKKDTISPSELKLPWKPLYDIYQTLHKRRVDRKKNYLNWMELDDTLGNLIQASKVYFPIEATQEILDELRPQLYINNRLNTLKLLGWFLPLQLPAEHHSVGHQLWFHELMQFWETNYYLKFCNLEMMHIMAKLASNNIGYIDWNPYIPIMFTRILGTMEILVSYKNIDGHSFGLYSDRISPKDLAKWVASVLGDKSDAQIYLDKFLKSTETYFYPVNFSFASMNLEELFIDITCFVTKRFCKERYEDKTWETPTPDSHKLTDANIDAFVTSMLPIAVINIFNETFHCAIQNLANLRPNLVIPKVLEKLNPLLDADTERHKLPSVLRCISVIMRPLVQGSRFYDKAYAFPEGPTYVMPLLFAALSGLNPNEPANSLAALNFIKTCALLIPIVDCSKSNLEKSETDQIICEETARLEDFVLQLMDRIFTLIKSLSQETIRIDNHANAFKHNAKEIITAETIYETFLFLLQQTSDKIIINMINKIQSFVLKEALDIKVAGPIITAICQAFSQKNGESTLKKFLPYLTDTIFDYFKDHTVEEQPNNQLLYSLLILQSIINTRYDALLPYLDTVEDIIDKVMLLKFCESQKLACNMLRNVLKTFCTIDRFWQSNLNSEYPHWKDWGKSADRESIKINLPTSDERKSVTAQSVFERFFIPSVTLIQNYINGKNVLTRDELHKHLRIISNVIEGCKTVLPIWNEPPLLSEHHKFCTATFEPITGVNFEITMPDGSNVRRFLVRLMVKLQEVILKNVEDDTKSLLLLLQIWRQLEGNQFQKFNHLVDERKFLCSIMEPVKMNIKSNKEYLHTILSMCVNYQHDWHVTGFIRPVTQTSKDIMYSLFKLSISQYSEIRRKAQGSLNGIFEMTSYSTEHILPLITEVLQKDTEVHHDAYKGVLYLLTQSDCFIKGDWQDLLHLLPALLLAKPTEKLSAINLQQRFHIGNRGTMNLTLDVPDQCVSVASKLWDCGIQPTEVRPSEIDINNGTEISKAMGLENLQVYNAILDKLITIASERNLHWRHRQRAIQFVTTLIHPECAIPPTVIRYLLNVLNHDLIAERKMAWDIMPKILHQLKRKHKKITIDVPSSVSPTKQGVRPDNQWLQYSSKNWPTSAKEWDEPRFVHKHYVGFYCWPKSLEVYAPSSEQPSLNRNSRQMSEQEREVDTFFNNAQNVNQLFKLLSIDRKKDDFENYYNFRHSLMFEGLFRNHGDDHLDLFLPHLEALIRDERQCAQRCAAELLAGLIRGAKHWTFEKTESLWEKLLPLVTLVLENANADTLQNWAYCFYKIFQNRDPNRMHWLVECLVDATLRTRRGKSSINEKACLRVFRSFATQQFWRVSELLQDLLVEFKRYLYENPLKGVRDELVEILGIIFYLSTNFQNEQGVDFEGFREINKFMTLDHELLKNLLDEDSKDGRKFLQSQCLMIKYCIMKNYVLISSFYKLYPIIIKMENNSTLYPELAKTCTETLAFLATLQLLPKHVPIALQAIKEGLQSESRSERISTVQFLEVFTFYNMNILISNNNWIDEIRSMVLTLLEDESVEVREKSAKVLTGMIHCTLITDRKALLDQFIKMAGTKHQMRQPSDSSQTICVQHAGILGICAFIQAHPYDIPLYVPPLFELLSSHMSDLHPIPATIRKTLSNFKRTHCNTTAGVQGLAKKLTSKQFENLQDLSIQPSYYS